MKKKNIKCILLMCLLLGITAYGQKYSTRTGTIKFEASVASFEEVAAENKSVSAVVEANTGEIAVLALMKGFRFKVALMEEHFNESYAETDKYPKATFKGRITDFSSAKLSEKPATFIIKGELTLHGKTKQITDKVSVSKSGSTILVNGSFLIKPADFDIEIPNVVSKKIAEEVTVSYNLSLKK